MLNYFKLIQSLNQLVQFHVDVYVAKHHLGCLSAFFFVSPSQSKKTCQIQALKMSGPSCRERTRCKWPRKTSGSRVWLCLHWRQGCLFLAGIQLRIMTCLQVHGAEFNGDLIFGWLPPIDLGEKQTRRDSSRPVGCYGAQFCLKGMTDFWWNRPQREEPDGGGNATSISCQNSLLDQSFLGEFGGVSSRGRWGNSWGSSVKCEVTSAWMAYMSLFGGTVGGRFFKMISPSFFWDSHCGQSLQMLSMCFEDWA